MSSTVTSLTRNELEAEVLRLRRQQPNPPRGVIEDGQAALSRRAAPADADVLFSAVEKTGLPMILSDPNRPDNPIIFVNHAFVDLTGYASDEVIGRNCRFLQGPETERVAELRAALAENRDCTVELTNHRRDGSAFVNALFVGPMFGPDGRLRYRFGSQLDVTDVHRDRRRLAESEERQRALFNSAVEMAIMATDCDGRVTDWNSGAERILGWSAAEMRGETIERIFTPQDRAAGRLEDEMREALAEGHAEDERWHLRKDGGRFYAFGDMTPLRGADGEHRGFVKAVSDRKARREAEARIAHSEQRYRGLFEAIDAGFCVFEMRYDEAGKSVDYRFLEINPAFARNTGLTDAVGRWMRDLAPDHEQFWFDRYGAVARTGEPQRFEARSEVLGRDYEIYAFRVDEPERQRVAALFSDITERRAAERQQAGLVELGERLRSLDEAPAMIDATLAIIAAVIDPGRVGLARLAGGGAADIVACRTSRNLPDIAGRHDLADFPAVRASFEAGRAIAVAEVRADPETAGDADVLARLGVAALVTVPVYEHGQAVEMLFVHDDAPRAWSADEIAFLRTAADRLQVGDRPPTW